MTKIQANGVLLFTAMIWGFGFIFQKYAMEYIEPFSFNAFRYIIGGLCLLPLVYFRSKSKSSKSKKRPPEKTSPALIKGAIIAGAAMFIGASLQQFGLLKTTVTNVSFITGLYIVIVPIIGLFLGHRYKAGIWVAISIAAGGLYLLSGMEGLSMGEGDFLVLCSTVSWACHVLLIDHLSGKFDGIKIAAGQFFACAAFSLIAAIYSNEKIIFTAWNEWKWVIASGLLPIGIGFTLQVVAQKYSPPAQAAIILSLESVFGAAAGYLFLEEILSFNGLIGAALMLAGCVLAQLFPPLPLANNR